MASVIAQQGMSRFLVVEVPEKEVTVETKGHVVDLSSDPAKVFGPDFVQVFIKWGYWERYQGDAEQTQAILAAYDARPKTEQPEDEEGE